MFAMSKDGETRDMRLQTALMPQFVKLGAVHTKNHFVVGGPDGRHADTYIDEACLFANKTFMLGISKCLAVRIQPVNAGLVILCPDLEPIRERICATMRSLSVTHTAPQFVSLQRNDRGMLFLPAGSSSILVMRPIIVVCTVLYEEPSCEAVHAIDTVLSAGGHIQNVQALWNATKSNAVAGMNVGVQALVNEWIPTHSKNTCPMCEMNLPINTCLGAGKAFMRATMRK